MRTVRGGLVLVLAVLLGATLYLALRGLGFWGGAEPQVKEFGPDEQEIAFLEPATNAEEWQRLVSALEHLQEHWRTVRPDEKPLLASTEGAYPQRTAEVPEVALAFADRPDEKLWIRWYKLSGEYGIADWVKKLRRRARPPLAVLGGGSSARAEDIADWLKKVGWDEGDKPAFLITTATAANDSDKENPRPLIERYAGRSFRFSFTNPLMVEAVLDFVQQTPTAWAHERPAFEPLAGTAGLGDAWGALGTLLASGCLQTRMMHKFEWADDHYSLDLARIFAQEFSQRCPLPDHLQGFSATVPYSVGDFTQPNRYEQALVDNMLRSPNEITPYSLLVLPTGAQRMRRLLGALYRQAPLDSRNLLVVSGDSVSFNNVYRDRMFAWDIRDMPIPLVFFAHRNPVDEEAGFAWTSDPATKRTTTGTHDLLLYRDVLEALAASAYDGGGLARGPAALVQGLKQMRWQPGGKGSGVQGQHVYAPRSDAWADRSRPLFDERGDRQRYTGEQIVMLRPHIGGRTVDSRSTLTVWSALPDGPRTRWLRVADHLVEYR